MINIVDKAKCCGCAACANKCPKTCIEMKADNEGFLYPMVDISICVKCNLCEKVCPILNPVKEEESEQRAFLVQHRDEVVRMESTAGGAFTAIASFVLRNGGIVFGAAYDEEFHVHHTYVEKEEELHIFRNSKYVQSVIGDSYKIAKDFLERNRMVCFSGTPCQIEGFDKFLGKKYGKLVLVDVVCHGIPSPLVWEKYLQYQQVKKRKIDSIRFRDKFYGYKYSTMSLRVSGQNVYHSGAQMDPMLRAFFSDISDRPTCYECEFKKRYRVSDLTIWDCFSVYNFDKKMDDDKGTTRVLCHTQYGTDIILGMADIIRYIEVVPEKLVAGVKEMYESVTVNPKRKQFFKDAHLMDGKELFQKYYPITAKIRIKTLLRKILLMTGLYKMMKMYLNKIKGR